jgi:DNA-binding beta-propeller fold protein YncE
MNERPLLLSLVAIVATTAACGAPRAMPAASEPPAATVPVPSSATSAPPTAAGGAPGSPDAPVAAAGPVRLTSRSVPLPGAQGPASLDFVVYEPDSARVWVPVGVTGSVDVFDTATASFTRVDGFKTTEKDVKGKKRTMGPSAATVGDGVVYIGNRASNEVCPVDRKTLKPGRCLPLSSPTDGVSYVASAREVWVTTPKDKTLTILDASKPDSLKEKTTVKTDGAPEGYAVDDAHGVFFTNLEDKGGTLAIDVKTRKVKATWSADCGADGPRGVAFDAAHNFVVVACTDHLQILDCAHDGARLGRLETGAGMDNIDLLDATVYAAAAKAARLTVAKIDDKGQFAVVATGDTAEGARNAVADARGNVYVPDAQGARLLVFDAAAAR